VPAIFECDQAMIFERDVRDENCEDLNLIQQLEAYSKLKISNRFVIFVDVEIGATAVIDGVDFPKTQASQAQIDRRLHVANRCRHRFDSTKDLYFDHGDQIVESIAAHA
jgi:hypothetical protein